jgi:hypothetical protein
VKTIQQDREEALELPFQKTREASDEVMKRFAPIPLIFFETQAGSSNEGVPEKCGRGPNPPKDGLSVPPTPGSRPHESQFLLQTTGSGSREISSQKKESSPAGSPGRLPSKPCSIIVLRELDSPGPGPLPSSAPHTGSDSPPNGMNSKAFTLVYLRQGVFRFP